MIIHDVAQGSPEWEQLRLGVPTCSGFHRIFAPHRRKPSRQRDLYLLQLVDEWAHKKPEESFANEWTRRGQKLEAVARFDYAMRENCTVRQVGFVTRDDGKVGGSPDGLVGNDTILEIKIPSPQIHRTYLDGKDPRHTAQIQGLLYVTERLLAHLYVYGEKDESVLKVIERDDEYLAEFVPVLDQFIADLDEAKAEVAANYARVG